MSFMHTTPSSARLSRATSIANWFTNRWSAGPKMTVAPTARHLPFPAPDDARGMHWRGEVHLVANQAPDSLAQTVAHEAIGHFGLRALLGKEWPHFMRHIQDGVRSSDPGLLKIRAHIRAAYVDDLGEYCLNPMQEADEIAAYVAEEILCMRTGEIRPARPWRQALQAVKGRFLREIMHLERPVSRAELEGMLLLAVRRMERGPRASVKERIGRLWQACCSMAAMFDPRKPPMSLEESQRLIEAADDWEGQKAQWSNKLGVLSSIAGMVAKLVFFGLILFGLAHLIGNTAAILLGCAFLYFRDRLEH